MTKITEAERPKRRQRRKDARPSEIVAAAMEVFVENGFGGAKMEEVALRAGVSKGTIFVYFPTKQDLFRAVAQTVISSNFARASSSADLQRPISEFVPLLLSQAASVGESPVASMVQLLIAEARAFPDLAQVWHDEVVAKLLTLVATAIERAQAKGEVRAGNARLYAFSILGPMLSGMLFREILGETGAELPDLKELASQHAKAILQGLLEPQA